MNLDKLLGADTAHIFAVHADIVNLDRVNRHHRDGSRLGLLAQQQAQGDNYGGYYYSRGYQYLRIFEKPHRFLC